MDPASSEALEDGDGGLQRSQRFILRLFEQARTYRPIYAIGSIVSGHRAGSHWLG